MSCWTRYIPSALFLKEGLLLPSSLNHDNMECEEQGSTEYLLMEAASSLHARTTHTAGLRGSHQCCNHP
jgi:hypothetical protein